MNSMITISWSARLVLLALILLLGLTWAGAAHAQDAFDDQYGSQVASGEAAIASANPTATASATAGPASGGEKMGILPDTGGPLLPFAALGILGLSSVGLLALRRSSDQRQDA